MVNQQALWVIAGEFAADFLERSQGGADVREARLANSRQRGSHIILIKAGQIASLCVPDHPTVKRGTLRALIRSAGLTVEEFLAAE